MIRGQPHLCPKYHLRREGHHLLKKHPPAHGIYDPFIDGDIGNVTGEVDWNYQMTVADWEEFPFSDEAVLYIIYHMVKDPAAWFGDVV